MTMLAYKLDTLEDVERLVDFCKQFKKEHPEHEIDITVMHSYHNVDGCSYFGVASFLGKVVTIRLSIETKHNLIQRFEEEFKKISKCY